jgi:hypothetical protein
MRSRRDFGDVVLYTRNLDLEERSARDRQELTKMASRRISTPRIVIFARGALERSSLVDRNGARAVLVLLVGVLDGSTERAKAIGLPGPHWAVWVGSQEIIGRGVCFCCIAEFG